MTSPETSYITFGHYEVERTLGRGAMGTVYLARDTRIGRRVALKTIAISAEQFDDSTSPKDFYERLQREAEVSGSLSHPNIVTLYEAGYEDGRISYLAMEYIEGDTLLHLMQSCSPSPLETSTALRLIRDVLRGLAQAHQNGIIHRDIKPANVLVTHDGMAKVADFGIARPPNSSMTAAGALMGTPNYMSPEQILGQPVTTKADVFSTGVMLFEMLTAVRPFAGADLTGTLHNVIRQPAPLVSDLNPAIPRRVSGIVAKLLAKSPDDRPAAAEALAEIERIDLGEDGKSGTELPHSSAFRAPWALMTIGIAILIAIFTVFAMAGRASRPSFRFSPAQLREFDEKRRAIDQAEDAYQGGRLQESIDRYTAYLKKYPGSPAAIEGRDRAREALEKHETPEQRIAKTKRRKRNRDDEDISPTELLSRIRKAFKH